MSQKNETPVLVLSLLITLGLIGGGLWWLGSRFNWGGFAQAPAPTSPAPGSGGENRPGSFQDRFSSGEKILISASAAPEKRSAVAAIAAENYSQAATELEAYLNQRGNRNDPEARIYLNNAQIGDNRAYTIAISVPLTASPDPALEMLRGVAQAQTEVNQQGGINGVPLKVLIVDDDNDPEIVRQVASTLVKDDDVLGVIGHFGSEATLAGSDIYQNGGLVMISPTSTSVEISNKGNYVFRTVPSDLFTAKTLADHVLETQNQENAAIYYNSASDYSTSLKNQFTTALTTGGGQLVEEFDVSAADFNARTSIDRARQRGAEVLVLATNTPTLEQALAVIRENNRQLPLLGGDSLYNPKVLEDGQANAEGMVVAVPWVLQANNRSPFVQNSERLWGGDVNWRTAMTYDAAEALIAGLRQDATRQGVQQALDNSNFEVDGATGRVQFLASGDRNQPMQLVVIQRGDRSSYGFDFVPLP